MTKDDLIGRLHRLNGHELEQTSGDSEGWESRVLQSMGVTVRHDLVTEQ